jgi:hypothetical protein
MMRTKFYDLGLMWSGDWQSRTLTVMTNAAVALNSCFVSDKTLYRPDDGGSKDLWNVGKLLPDYTALQPRRQPYSDSSHYYTVTDAAVTTSLPAFGCRFEVIHKTCSFSPRTESYINQSLIREFVIPWYTVCITFVWLHFSFVYDIWFERHWSLECPTSFYIFFLFRGFNHFVITFWSTSSDVEWLTCHIYTHKRLHWGRILHYTSYLWICFFLGFVLLNMLRVACRFIAVYV